MMPDDVDDFLEEDQEQTASGAQTLVTLTSGAAGERLDRWLADQLPDRSRAEVQRWIEAGRVTRGAKVLRASYRLSQGDTISVNIPDRQEYHVEPEPLPLHIIYEDDDLLVIDKQAGMVVHPAAGNWHGTLVNAVLYHCPALVGVGGTGRPGIVHRLDKDTSGLILVAKNDRAHRDLQAQFRDRIVQKTYRALCYGQVTPLQGEIQAPIGRDPQQRKRMAIVPGPSGRPAVTQYDVQAYYGNYTLLSCHPLTGRTHQIRVHLAYIKHPIVGDIVYGGRRHVPVPISRQFLHAERLRFRLPSTGEVVEFRAPLPEDLAGALEWLSSKT